MKINRRTFLKGGGLFAGTFCFPELYVSYNHIDRNQHGVSLFYNGPSNSCSPLEEPLELKIATWNICGIPGKLDTPLSERIPLIGRMIAEFEPDLVGFQEAFLVSSRKEIIKSLAGTDLRFHTYFPSRIGSGLLTVSAFPIVDKDFIMYEAQGNPINPNGEWYAGKGIGRTRINFGKGVDIDFFNTHIHAGDLEYLDIRKNQRDQCTNFVSRYLGNDKPTFLTSDLNCFVGDDEYLEFIGLSDLVRVMDGRFRGKEHIHAGNLEYNGVRNIETWEIPEILDHRGIQLSDHPGYVSKILIRPYS